MRNKKHQQKSIEIHEIYFIYIYIYIYISGDSGSSAFRAQPK